MKHYLFVSIFFTLTLNSLLAQDEIDVAFIVPEKVTAGSEFSVNVNIQKGNFSGIARFQIDFPNGFEVFEKKSANGEFRFQDQSLIIQWLKLPVEEEIELSFTVKVNPTIEGFFVLKGGFYYIQGNEKKLKELYPHIITVEPATGDFAVSKISVEQNIIDISGIVNDEISCIRQKPVMDENNEITVNLLITKGTINKFGKIEEQIPVGYKAVNESSRGAIFVFNQKSRTVKYMWMNMPAESQFKITYKLIPIGDISNEPFIIQGKFLYAENNTTKEVNVVERNIQF